MNNDTRPLPSNHGEAERIAHFEQPALVLVWAAGEFERIGEVLILPPDSQLEPCVFGRMTSEEVARRRLFFCRQRPGSTTPIGSSVNPHLSRNQLELGLSPAGGIQVRNIGRLTMAVNGKPANEALIRPGDLIDLEGQMLLLCINRSGRLKSLRGEYTFSRFGTKDGFDLVGESEAMWDLRQELLTKAQRGKHVLIFGPSGAGKELAARAIAAAGGHTHPVTAAAPDIPDSLLESELFGNIADYPNHGMVARRGLIGEANDNTLILDEIGEIPHQAQTRLLRVMATGEYKRLGRDRVERSNFRLVAATNRDKSYLRHDFYARFKDVVHLPGLNERREDIPLLATHLLKQLAKDDPEFKALFFERSRTGLWPKISSRLMAFLVTYPYETHVRELEKLLIRAIDASAGRAHIDLPTRLRKELESEIADRLMKEEQDARVSVQLAPSFDQRLDPVDREQLELLRRAEFSPTTLSRDIDPSQARQTASLHLTQLVAQALAYSGWQIKDAAHALAGGDSSKLQANGPDTIK